jgi:hypothetical protein
MGHSFWSMQTLLIHWVKKTNTVKKKTGVVLDAGREVGSCLATRVQGKIIVWR